MGKTIKVVHISNNYYTSKVYRELFSELKSIVDNQYVIINLKRNFEFSINHSKTMDDSIGITHLVSKSIINFKFLSEIHMIIKTMFDILKFKKDSSVVFHAHNLFSNGIPAYFASFLMKNRYVVSVRSGDLYKIENSVFYKFIGKKVLKRASEVVYITGALKNKVSGILSTSKRKVPNIIKENVIGNGLNSFYLENSSENNGDLVNNILCVSSFVDRKNIVEIILGFKEFLSYNPKAILTLVGDGPSYNKILKTITQNKLERKVSIKGWTTDKDEMLSLYRESDIFILPSRQETFGLVYLEALSQSLPIILLDGEGISDEIKDLDIGLAIKEVNKKEISSSLIYINENYNRFCEKSINFVKDYSWENIAKQYRNLYFKNIHRKE